MGLVDDIRRYVFYRYIKPAIDRGQGSITLRAGDIHNELHLHNRVPAVCTALGSRKSIEIFNRWLRELGYKVKVDLSVISTPPSGQGANSYYTYSFSFMSKKTDEEDGLKRVARSTTRSTVPNKDALEKRICEEITEDDARKIMSKYLGVSLYKERIDINGKPKEFDIVNTEHRIVGDFKCFEYQGSAGAELSNLAEYVWLMEKLEKHTGVKWRKIIVGAGNRKTFEAFARRYDPWLEDVEIYYITPKRKVIKIR